jgi:hypothetical protein
VSRNPLRYFPPREPKPIGQLTRPQIAARVFALRSALDTLVAQSDLDGAAVFNCTGSMRRSLIELEEQLRQLDRQAGQPLAAALVIPEAEQRLRQAGADLSEVIREIALDRVRALTKRVPHAPQPELAAHLTNDL